MPTYIATGRRPILAGQIGPCNGSELTALCCLQFNWRDRLGMEVISQSRQVIYFVAFSFGQAPRKCNIFFAGDSSLTN